MKDFEKIYSEYYDAVFQYVLSLCRDEQWAEEITQEAFFKALKSIDTFRGECKLSVWLCQIAKNTFYTSVKRQQRQVDYPLELIQSDEAIEQKIFDKETAFQISMLQNLKRKCRPTTFLLIVGFAISLTSVLIGISSVNSLISSLSEMDSKTPIYLTMQNTGLSLALAIYVFSVANCLVVTNYWIITKRRDMAIRKAFGWSNRRLICLIISEMVGTLTISLVISAGLLAVLENWDTALFSIELTPFFVIGTCGLLLFTLFVSVLIPAIQILKIRPAEVIS